MNCNAIANIVQDVPVDVDQSHVTLRRSLAVTTLCLTAFGVLARPAESTSLKVGGASADHWSDSGVGTASLGAARASAERFAKRVVIHRRSKRLSAQALSAATEATVPDTSRTPTVQPTTVAAIQPSTTAARTTVPTTQAATTTNTTPPTTATPTTAAAPTTTRAATAPVGWQTIFEDNFDGGAVDSSKLSIENRPATNMGEISFYAADDVFTRNGSMILRTQNRSMGGRSYTTGQASSNFNFQYGRVEFRAKMPVGQGFWPALWMLPADGATSGWLPEIDIFEAINHGGNYFANFHFPSGGGQAKLGPVPVTTDTTAWHTYGLDWTPDKLAWTLDGQVVVSTTDVASTRQHHMFLLITFALGGQWPGPPDGSTPFPSEMQIDWVRVMQQR